MSKGYTSTLDFMSSGVIPWGDHLNQFEELISKLRDLGLSIHPGSRLPLEYKILAELARNGGRLGCHSAEQVAAIMTDWYQMSVVCETASRRQTDEEFIRRLGESVNGHHGIKYENSARDVQFELFTLSCLKSELVPKLIAGAGSPDIMLERMSVSVEAKRAKNYHRLKEGVRKGLDQITRVASTGVVATDLTAILLAEGMPSADDADEAGLYLANWLHRYQQSHVNQLFDNPAAVVWSSYVSAMFYNGAMLFGPIGLWGHVDTVGSNYPAAEHVKTVFASPREYSPLQPTR